MNILLVYLERRGSVLFDKLLPEQKTMNLLA